MIHKTLLNSSHTKFKHITISSYEKFLSETKKILIIFKFTHQYSEGTGPHHNIFKASKISHGIFNFLVHPIQS
jgi:hypothetical protein